MTREKLKNIIVTFLLVELCLEYDDLITFEELCNALGLTEEETISLFVNGITEGLTEFMT